MSEKEQRMSKTIKLDNAKLPLAMAAYGKREDVARIIYDWLHEAQVTHRRDYDTIPEDQKQAYRTVASKVMDGQSDQLRETVQNALAVFGKYRERHLVPAAFSIALRDLREAIAPKGVAVTTSEPSHVEKTQCADCWAWIKRDESHTCKRQVARNRKGNNDYKTS